MAPALRPPRISHEQRILLLALTAGTPGVLAALIVLWTGGYSAKVQWTVAVVVAGFWLIGSYAVRERVVNPLRTLANLLEAMREGDYSIRGRLSRPGDALHEVMQQVNAMGATLRAQRLGALEATTLLRKVMEEIDVAVFAFDEQRRLRLVNRAGERLLAQPAERALGATAEALALDRFLEGETAQTVQRTFPGGSGRWGISRTSFRESGLPHQMLVVTDLTRPLREEELQAWQRLVRVLGHELNNSLTPIKSIAGSLERLLALETKPEDWEDDMRGGLSVIASRSEALSRFLGAYARLAKLPRPRFQPLVIGDCVRRVAGIETRLPVTVEPGPELTISADPDQIEQLLINLVRNAADASLETGGGVSLGWTRGGAQIEVRVRDEGPGLSNTANLFVPFFTTKPGGSGIGLVFCRQIAEAHGGALRLENRAGGRGCEALLTLPL
ncbi:MAG: PAS domain-containing protein [Acidobacteria bacterium]|nr:PAS domain-containing protein [Acidobacteriota bacterium]